MTKFYLAARYSRRAEMVRYSVELLDRGGHEVTSRWIEGAHRIPKGRGVDEDEARRFALEDLADIDAADVVLCFTEEAGTPHTRGGRHVEFGYALARGKRCYCIGPCENVFYWLLDVPQYLTFEGFWSQAGRYL